MSWKWTFDNPDAAAAILREVRNGKIPINSLSTDMHEWPLLMLASYHNLVDDVVWLLSSGADVHAKTQGGWTALLWAADVGAFPVVQALVEAGAHLDEANIEGETALMRACLLGDHHMARFLLRCGADLNATRKAYKKLRIICNYADVNDKMEYIVPSLLAAGVPLLK